MDTTELNIRTQERLSAIVSASPLPSVTLQFNLVHVGGVLSHLGRIYTGGVIRNPFAPTRPASLLPTNPLEFLNQAYLHCKKVQILSAVSADELGAQKQCSLGSLGVKGDVDSAMGVFSIEESIEAIFTCLTEVLDDEDDSELLFELDGDGSLANFKLRSGFTPDTNVEFVGRVRLLIELDYAHGVALFESGDRWMRYRITDNNMLFISTLFERLRFLPNQSTDPAP
jgi:hypothetical protein